MKTEHEVDVVALWWLMWDHKILVAAITAVFTALALFYAFTAVPVYRATVVVTLVHDKSLGADSGMAGGLGGLASLAGIDIGATGADQEREAVMHSRHLVEEFVKRPDVMQELRSEQKEPLSLWKTVEFFKKAVVDVEDDKLKGTITITMDWTDAAIVARWANEFVALANDLMRNKAIADSTRNVEFLNQQIDHTSSVNVQKVMYNLIESETKNLMLANGRKDYAFAVADPAVAPEKRVRPWRSLILLSGIAIGLFMGCFIVYVRARFSRSQRGEPYTQGATTR
jgi:uncharacterized protein involved in exopolysaccharide biosynthesis